jgi:hypothetical protein
VYNIIQVLHEDSFKLNNNKGNNMTQQIRGGQTDKKTSFFQSRMTVYDNMNSALKLGFAYSSFNHFGYLDFAPVHDSKRGKEPVKGESVYDYDNNQMAVITGQVAVAALAALNHVLSGEVNEVSIALGKSGKYLSFCNTLAVYGPDVLPNPETVSPLTVAIIGNVDSKEYEILNVFADRVMYTANSGEINMTGCPELDLLTKFLENCILHATSGTFTDAVAAVSIYGGSQSTERTAPPPVSASVKRTSALRSGGTGAGTGSSSRLSGNRTAETTDAPQPTGSRFAATRNAGQTEAQPRAEETSTDLNSFVNSLGDDDIPNFENEII